MRATRVLILALLVACGCGRKKPAPQVVVPQTAANPANGALGGVVDARADPTLNPIYQGQTVQQWAPMLENRDPVMRNRASVALGRMGPPGGAVLIKGMRNSSAAVRLSSLQSATRQQLLDRRGESITLLRQMLRDPNPDIRRAASARLTWFGQVAASDMAALQDLAKNDEDANVRNAASDALYAIDQSAKTGGKNTRGVGLPQPAKK